MNTQTLNRLKPVLRTNALLLVLALLIAGPALAQTNTPTSTSTPTHTFTPTHTPTAAASPQGVTALTNALGLAGDPALKASVEGQYIYAVNKHGSAISAGDLVSLDGTAIAVVAASTSADDMTIAASLAAESGWWHTLVLTTASAATAGTATVTGTDQNGAVVSRDVVVASSTPGPWRVDGQWKTVTDLDAADLANGAGTTKLDAYPAIGVVKTAANGKKTIGVVVDGCRGTYALDNEWVRVQTSGIAMVNTSSATLLPGDPIGAGSTAGECDEVSDAGETVGFALQPAVRDTAGAQVQCWIIPSAGYE